MSSTDRQSRLLVTEDWKKIYQSFRNADFQSYDFDNLRRTMINYLRQNYPEDFNDYIESSEYLALIDLIAFLGQNLSFRVDLNARENFLETAERRESVLRLAKLISYNPSRNKPANGLLKFDTVTTTESVKDSTGLDLAGTTVTWNDRANPNYFEQFIKIINAALPQGGGVGSPIKTADIQGISTEQYRFNALNTDIPSYGFNKPVEGLTTRFEVVSTTLNGNTILEEPPLPGNSPSFLYRDDGQGAGSSNTGFFMHFRQGTLESSNFNVQNPIPNQVVSIDDENINNSDIWVYGTDSNGFETTLWTKLDSVEGNNIIYNSIFKDTKNVYSVSTRTNDRINLVFSDGVFGNLPSGGFRIYYRTSDNRNMIISPSAVTNVNIEIPYISRANRQEILTIGLSLKTTVNNSRPSESNADIKADAPSTYYTQNRLITAEDYNIGPLGIDQDIIKTKTVNRISSGISKYLDLRDPTGKYSTTKLYASDGVIYKQEYTDKFNFDFVTQADIEGVVYTQLEPLINSEEIKSFYQQNFSRQDVTELNAVWRQTTNSTNRSTGYLQEILNSNQLLTSAAGVPISNAQFYPVGSFATNNLQFFEVGALVKFKAPQTTSTDGAIVQQYFLENNTLTVDSNASGSSLYKWAVVQGVNGDGTLIDEDGFGAITFNDVIPEGSKVTEILPRYVRNVGADTKRQIIDRAFAYRDFGLRYSQTERQWKIITAEDINTFSGFSLQTEGNTIGENLDTSWLFYFQTDGSKYTVTYRALRYVFESADEIKFYFDNADKIFDPKTGKTQKDSITVLGINPRSNSPQPFNKDFVWSISNAYKDAGGYNDTRKIQLALFDSDDDGIADNPDIFSDIVNERAKIENRFIFQEKYSNSDGVEDFRYVPNPGIKVLQNESTPIQPSAESDGQVFYFVDFDLFKVLDKTQNNMTVSTNYRAFVGRDRLKFEYVHVADQNYRIDPARSNILDTFLLTRGYDNEMRSYLRGEINNKPLPPSTDELFRSYGSEINKIKSISDEVVYHPVKYKILFGSKADSDLQVTFKIVKNSEVAVNNNELKANVIDLINRYFSIENWDFGETFYFQELATYVMNNLSPDLVSFIIVPKRADQGFGSLFEIKSETDEIFANGATVNDIEIINQHTASNLQSNGKVITSISSNATGIQTRSPSDPTTLPSTTAGSVLETGNTAGTLNPPSPLEELDLSENADPFEDAIGNTAPIDPTYNLRVIQVNNTSIAEDNTGPFVIQEGDSFVIQLTTTDISNGQTIPYNISGLDTFDLNEAPLTGQFVIQNNTAIAGFQLSDTIASDRPTVFKLTLNDQQVSIELPIAGLQA